MCCWNKIHPHIIQVIMFCLDGILILSTSEDWLNHDFQLEVTLDLFAYGRKSMIKILYFASNIKQI